MTHKPNQRLSAEDWIKAAFCSLSSDGINAVKAEVLAKQLKSTKGSFYWHFKDVPTFKREMLKQWEAEATAAIKTEVMTTGQQGQERLQILVQLVSQLNTVNEYGGLQAEPSIRAWAQNDTSAATALRRIDSMRMDFVCGLFIESGQSAKEARERSELFYSCFVGLQAMAANASIDILPRMQMLLRLLLLPEDDHQAKGD